MKLEKVCDGVFEVRGDLRLGVGFYMPVRATLLRLSTGGLLVCSPIDFDDETQRAIDALGPVEQIVAPSLLHHLFAGHARRRWPRARLLGAPGLAEKRPDLALDATLSPGSLDDDVACLPVDGAPSVNEHVLLHRPSRTLVVVDLVFNITAPRGLVTPFVLWMMGVRGRLAQSRAWRFALVRDREAYADSMARLLSTPFDRLVPSHGETIEQDGKAALAKALAPMLGQGAAQLAAKGA